MLEYVLSVKKFNPRELFLFSFKIQILFLILQKLPQSSTDNSAVAMYLIAIQAPKH